LEIIWQPNKGPQTFALSISDVYETLYGGARGGGKTDAGIVWLGKNIDNPLFRGLVIRKTAEDLSDWLSRAKRLYSSSGVIVAGKPAVLKFPSGAEIRCGHLRDDSAYEKYQGHEYHRMLLEELGQIPNEESYLKLISSCRSTVKGLDPQVFATANPGGRGHAWIKSRFGIGVHDPNIAFRDPISGRYRIFIPATIHDNPILAEADPDYIKYLDSLPEPLRSAWLLGDWDVFSGQYFTEFHPRIHVISEEKAMTMGYGNDINANYVGIDWGFAAPFCALWNQVTSSNKVFFDGELYGTEKHPAYWGEMIANRSRGKTITSSLGDPSMWIRNPMSWNNPSTQMPSDKSIADSLMASGVINLVPANNSRVNGWRNMAQLMHYTEAKKPQLYLIEGTCPNLERTIPIMVRDEKNLEDIDTTLEDHAVDAARYSLSMVHAPSEPRKKLTKNERKIEELMRIPDDDDWHYEF